MSQKKKTWIIKVEARDKIQLGTYLNLIGKMIHDGYTSGVDTPTYWDLVERKQ
jgi:hypothetical protein